MIECRTDINIEAQKVLSKNLKLASIISLVVGVVGAVSYIVLSCFFDSGLLDIMLVFCLPLGFGLVYLVSINNLIKKTGDSTYNVYQFEEEFFNTTTYKGGEVVGTVKYYYKDLKKIKERDGYLLLYINVSNAFLVKESALSESDLATVKSFLRIGINKNK